jgi:hypothetical protein
VALLLVLQSRPGHRYCILRDIRSRRYLGLPDFYGRGVSHLRVSLRSDYLGLYIVESDFYNILCVTHERRHGVLADGWNGYDARMYGDLRGRLANSSLVEAYAGCIRQLCGRQMEPLSGFKSRAEIFCFSDLGRWTTRCLRGRIHRRKAMA